MIDPRQTLYRRLFGGAGRRWLPWIGMLLAAFNIAAFAGMLVDRGHLYETARRLVPPGTGHREVVRRLTEFVRAELHHCNYEEVLRMPLLLRWNYLYNPFHIGPRTALEHGGDFRGSCGSSCRVLAELLRAHGIRSRSIIIVGTNESDRHTVLEVWYDGAWGVVDPLYGIVYQHSDGRPASLIDLRRDHDLFLRNAETGWEYGYGPGRKEHVHAYNARKYPFTNAYYFNYDKLGPITRTLRSLLRATFGDDATLWIKRPDFYTYPALTAAVVVDAFVLVGAGALVTVMVLRRRTCRSRLPSSFPGE